MFSIEQKVAQKAKRAGLFSGGLLLCGVGAAFLTVAGWFALSPIYGVAVTALLIASVYLGAGFICVGVASGHHVHPVEEKTAGKPAASDSPPIVQAFMYGLQAGSQADEIRRR